MTTHTTTTTWLRTSELCRELGVHRNTILNLVKAGVFVDGMHRRKINPLSPRGRCLYTRDECLFALGRA